MPTKHTLLPPHLVLALECEDVGNFSKGQAQRDHLRLRRLVGELSDVEHAGRRSFLHLLLFAVTAVRGTI